MKAMYQQKQSKKKEYEVNVAITMHGLCCVRADSEEEALKKARKAYEMGDVIWNGEEVTDLSLAK